MTSIRVNLARTFVVIWEETVTERRVTDRRCSHPCLKVFHSPIYLYTSFTCLHHLPVFIIYLSSYPTPCLVFCTHTWIDLDTIEIYMTLNILYLNPFLEQFSRISSILHFLLIVGFLLLDLAYEFQLMLHWITDIPVYAMVKFIIFLLLKVTLEKKWHTR